MHTVEHLLNGNIVKLLGSDPYFSAHTEKKKSKCDYYLDKDHGEEKIKLVEDKVNEVIRENLSVSEKFINLEKQIKDLI